MLQFLKLQIIGGNMPAVFQNKQDIVRDFDRSLKKCKDSFSFDEAYSVYIKNYIQDKNIKCEKDNSNWSVKVFGLPEQDVKPDMVVVYEKDRKRKKLGAEIKRLRTAQGWSTQKLSGLSGMSLGFINQLENGSSTLPKASNLTHLAKIFGIDSSDLLYLAGYIEQKPVIDFDWQISIKNQLSNIGIKNNYINEIIDYIETVQIKQERQEAKPEAVRNHVLTSEDSNQS